MSESVPVRRLAREALTRILRDGQSLSAAREPLYKRLDQPRDRAFAMVLVQGVLRWRWKLDAVCARCMDKPLRNKEHEVRHVLYLALYELMALSTPDYAVVDEAVKQVQKLRRGWARGLVNAVLRTFQRERDQLLASLDEAENLSHPPWLQSAIQGSWPDDWRSVLHHNNEIPETHLRVNRMHGSVAEYASRLDEAGIENRAHPLAADCLIIGSTDVTVLPGYAQGDFSVQDAGAQQVSTLVDVTAGMRVLDLCSAPGGKACHLLEATSGELELLAVDIDSDRLQRIEQNLERLGLGAGVMQADASQAGWYDLAHGDFDRIVLDAPCSASGVIRRHPDIKSLRQPEDIEPLIELQRQILDNAWPLLRPGGVLLYVTCSVLRQENSDQIARFLAAHDDAAECDIDVDWGRACEHGRQLLPGIDETDGFYFALLRKSAG